MKKIIMGMTGASGAPYAKRMIEVLKGQCDLHLVYSKTAPLVFSEEVHEDLGGFLREQSHVKVHKLGDFLSPLASGSNSFDAYLMLPCSMKTLGQVAHGTGETLLTRIADIALKERRRLVMVTREAPYSEVHLQNMLSITRMGGIIFPASPGFYHCPKTIEDMVDFVVARVLQLIGLEQSLVKPWKAQEE